MISIKRSGNREERVRVSKSSFVGVGKDVCLDQIKNADVSDGYLRVCKAWKAPTFTVPSTVYGIFSANGRMIVAANEGGHMAFYSVTGEISEKNYVSVQTFSQSMKFDEFCTIPVFTDDGSPHFTEEVHDADKLLLFPGRKVLILAESGSPISMLDMPSEVPEIQFAVFHSGRMFGAGGNYAYVSGISGCFDWEMDQSGSDPDPINAWKGKLTANAEEEQPVTGMTVYDGVVYVFKKGSIQKFVGTENPYRIENVYNVGTSYCHSVCEVAGKLYFLSDDGPMVFDGRYVKNLPHLPEGTEFNGAAGKMDGKYAFYGKNGDRHLIFLYDEDSKSYGIKDCSEEVIAFAETGKKQYILQKDEENIQQYVRVLSGRTGEQAEYCFPLCRKQFDFCGATVAAIRGSCKGEGRIEACLVTCDETGTEKEYPLGVIFTSGGEVLFRRKRKLPRTASVFLKIVTVGDVILRGYECEMRLKN